MVKGVKLPKNTIIYDKNTPNLLLSLEHIKRYRNKTDKFFFNAFYMWSKKELNIIPKIKSQDNLNRQKPKNIICVSQPYNDVDVRKDISKYIDEASKYVEKHFKKNCGFLDKKDFIYPITRADSLKWLEHFIKNKLKNYGNYQDYIDKNNRHLCHSLMSALINIGLINPGDIIDILEKERKTRDIPMNSYEGFIRQLFWREYQHLCYLYVDFSGNYFGNNKFYIGGNITDLQCVTGSIDDIAYWNVALTPQEIRKVKVLKNNSIFFIVLILKQI